MVTATTVREATSADLDAVVDVHYESWHAAYKDLYPTALLAEVDRQAIYDIWLPIFAALDPPRRNVLVAHDQGSVCGVLDLLPYEEPQVVEFTRFYVAPSRWRRGVGTELLAAAEHNSRQAGYEQGILWVVTTNARARRFYKKNEWEQDGGTMTLTGANWLLPMVRYRRNFTQAV